MTPEQLAAQLNRDATIVGRTIPGEIVGIVVDVAELLADVTPFLTGRARSGWVASRGAPATAEPGITSPSGVAARARRRDFERALESLFAAKKIRLEPYDRPAKGLERIVRA